MTIATMGIADKTIVVTLVIAGTTTAAGATIITTVMAIPTGTIIRTGMATALSAFPTTPMVQTTGRIEATDRITALTVIIITITIVRAISGTHINGSFMRRISGTSTTDRAMPWGIASTIITTIGSMITDAMVSMHRRPVITGRDMMETPISLRRERALLQASLSAL